MAPADVCKGASRGVEQLGERGAQVSDAGQLCGEGTWTWCPATIRALMNTVVSGSAITL